MMRIWQNKSRAMVVTVCLALLATPVIIDQVAKQVPSQAGVWDVTSALRYDSEGTIIGAPLQDLINRDDYCQVINAPFVLRFFDATYTKLGITTNGTVYPTSGSCSNRYDKGMGELAMAGSAPMIAVLASDQDSGNPLMVENPSGVLPSGPVTNTSGASGGAGSLTVTTTADVSSLVAGDKVYFFGTGDSDLDRKSFTLTAVNAGAKTMTFNVAGAVSNGLALGNWYYYRGYTYGAFTNTSTAGGVVTVQGMTKSEGAGLSPGDKIAFQSANSSALNGNVFTVSSVGSTTATFTLPAGYSPSAIPDATATGTWFFSDGVGAVRTVNYGTTSIDGRQAAVVTWYRAPQYHDQNLLTLFNTFQMVLVKRGTGSDSAGWDFDIEFNYGTLKDDEDGYKGSDPTSECDAYSGGVQQSDYSNCRWGVGWADYRSVKIDKITYDATPTATITTMTPHGAEGTGSGVWIKLPNTSGAADMGNLTANDRAFARVTGPNTLTFTPATPKLPQDWSGSEPDLELSDEYELYGAYPISRLIDSGDKAMVANSLNTSVLGRYTFSMVGGVTQGFQTLAQVTGDAPAPASSAGPTPGPTGIPYDWESANSPENPAFRVGGSPSASASPSASGSPSVVATAEEPRLDLVRTAEVAALPPGRAVVYVNGQPVSVTVTRTAGGGGVAVSSAGTSIILAGRGSDGDALGLNPDGVLMLQSLQGAVSANLRSGAMVAGVRPVVEMRGDGYEPNKPVKLFLLSYGYMGQVLADSNGDFFGYVTMPEGIASGPHTLQANGYNPMREVRSLSLGVQVTGKSGSQLATKQASGVVSFLPGSTKLTKKTQAAVKAVLAKAGKGSVVKVSVVGYGPKTGNTLLAAKRAQAVAAYLKSLGLTATITADGSGVAKATSRKARQVVITISHT